MPEASSTDVRIIQIVNIQEIKAKEKMMNGYNVMAEALKRHLSEQSFTPEEKASLKEKISIYEFLSGVSDSGKYALFDSSMFNDIFKGYVKMIMDDLTEAEDKDIKRAAELLAPIVNRKAYSILEEATAKQAEEYYLK